MRKSELERILGGLEEFREWEGKEHSRIEKRLDSIEAKIDELKQFKWQIVGMGSAMSFLISTIITLVMR